MKTMNFFDSSNSINLFKLYISPYKLRFKSHQQKILQGCLFCFDFGSDLIGYSDFLPWPHFGEASLSQQLNQIQKKNFSQRFFIAKKNAFLDAQARSQKRNLFFGLNLPPSHFLIEDLLSFHEEETILKEGFKFVKVKLKKAQIKQQILCLKKLQNHLQDIKWRFDLNGQDWSFWKNPLSFLKEHIDFIEDPQLLTFQKKDNQLFAQDWISHFRFQIKIVKASRDDMGLLEKELSFFRWKRLIFTHSFDHPLGQSISAFWSAKFYKNHPSFFETGAFTNFQLLELDSYPLHPKQALFFSPPSGFGFGFSSSLKKEKWKRWL